MKKILLVFMLIPSVMTAQTLDECQQAAERNYPLIRQYDLITKTTDLTVKNLQKGWLPQLSAQAQATLQSDVTSWPDQMQTMMQQMGICTKGLSKGQYRLGIDVQQTVFDGGLIRSQQQIARQQGKIQEAQNEATLYQVRQRVNEMYFALLLTEERIRLTQDLQTLLTANEKKLAAMVKGGTAAASDEQTVKAERLNAVQQLTELQSQKQMLRRLMTTFCGIEVAAPVKPSFPSQAALQENNARPELKVLDAQIQLANAQEKALDAALMPKLGVFAQGFYGYPGYNMFEDMMKRQGSWNGMIGARLTWNIGALYTRKNDKAKLNAQRSMFNVQREVFLFNNRMEQLQESENMTRYQRLMATDNDIIALRSSVRKAAESKLSHGIIDVNDLVREINQENAARVQQSIHELELLKEMYDQKYTTNH